MAMQAELLAANDDLVMELLLRLPPKSLARFKSVSTHWHSLISSVYFSCLHGLRHPTNPISGVFLRASSSNHYHFLPLSDRPYLSSQFSIPLPSSSPPLATGLRILQSCDGLLLCRSVEMTIGPRDYSIYNPVSKFFKALPRFKPLRVLGVTLAFDSDKLPHYHVVCVGNVGHSDSNYRIVVYSSSTGCWKEWIGNDFYVPYEVVFSNGVNWKGAVHWIAAASRNDSVYFDVENERLCKMASPPMCSRRGLGTFNVCDGKLCYVDANVQFFRVYAMENYEAGWSLRYNVEIDGVMGHLPKASVENYSQSLLCLAREEGEGKLVMVVHAPGKIFAYDLEGRNCKKLCDVELGKGDAPGNLLFSGFDAYPYAASLAFVR